MKRLIFTVTNDLSYDQRMLRICQSLSKAGFDVLLVGKNSPGSIPLMQQPFSQKRLTAWWQKGKLLYIEYNFRLFWYLLFKRADLICAIDLDTILPVYAVSCLKNSKRVYDAHELFCEMKEVVTRPMIYKFWKYIERFAVPRFKLGYTVSEPIALEFRKLYGVEYGVIRNVPALEPVSIPPKEEKYILYQGAVNEGRSFETLIPAMKNVQARLIVCGDGNFMDQAKQLVYENQLEDKVIFKGKIPPEDLNEITVRAWAGITLFDAEGLSNYYSLANRFFDYIRAGIPQLCVNYPAYRAINKEYGVALMIDDLKPPTIANALNRLLCDQLLYDELQQNCLRARNIFNWQQEEMKLLEFYTSLFE